ncbi:ATP-binding protein [Pontiellaceae bacterium B1224]|nr:ATP-binding protein [Pontiellaceae bacterium B1224]
MKELVIISGKGGTGKTSITASLAALAETSTLADCDVDAADLHLVLEPTIQTSETFTSGRAAEIRAADCTQCGLCEEVCRFDAIADFTVDPLSCEGCGACVEFCPVGAIDFPEQDCGVWNISTTRHGPMVHAHMNPGAENSGKLVSLVRQEARKMAAQQNSEFLLVDGPPGIGCPVIASITGADAVLVVSEPTLSGEHDLHRVLELAAHFKIPAMVCVNKWDINPVMTDRIEDLAKEFGAAPVGRIPYDAAVTAAQVNARALVEESAGEAAQAVRDMWSGICSKMH